MARKLSKAKKKQYAEARRKRLEQKELAAAKINATTNCAEQSVPLTPTQKLHQLQAHNDSISRRLDELVAENERLREQVSRDIARQNDRHLEQADSLKSEISRLRSLLANITFGGQHVRNIDVVEHGVA